MCVGGRILKPWLLQSFPRYKGCCLKRRRIGGGGEGGGTDSSPWNKYLFLLLRGSGFVCVCGKVGEFMFIFLNLMSGRFCEEYRDLRNFGNVKGVTKLVKNKRTGH